MAVKKAAVIGLGLIGGSLGAALRKFRPDIEISGCDLDAETGRKALERGIVDSFTVDSGEAVRNADLIFIAVYVSGFAGVLSEIKPFLKEGAIVSDVGSTKGSIMRTADEILGGGTCFVGGHPMAGSEDSGIDAADPYLFENAVYILTPAKKTSPEKLSLLKGIVAATGANTLVMDAEEHDLKVAAISHLPHFLASVLVNTVGGLEEEKEGFFQLAAGGFRDMTRIADSSPEMWDSIFADNRKALGVIFGRYCLEAEKLSGLIGAGKTRETKEYLEKSRSYRSELPEKIKSLLPEVKEIIVSVPDVPGIIGRLAMLLGDRGLNITDIAILRAREDFAGSIRIGFRTEEEAERSIEVLEEKGYKAFLR